MSLAQQNLQSDIDREIYEVMGDQIDFDMEQMFPKREGFFNKRTVRGKLKLLKNLLPSLQEVLMDGEQVLYIAKGVVIRFWETFFAGAAVAHLMNISCVVLTDRRIIIFNTNAKGKQKLYRNQILYTQIRKAKMTTLFGYSKLQLLDGKSIELGGFKGIDKKQIKKIIPEMIAAMPENAPQVDRSVQYLCPCCDAIYTEYERECKRCGVQFKSRDKAARMSLMMPGLGDLYLGHRLFGVIELMGSIFEWMIAIGAVIAAIGAMVAGQAFLDLIGFAFLWLIIIAVTNVIDFYLTHAMASKGLIADKKPT